MDRAARQHRKEGKAARQRARQAKGRRSPANEAAREPDDSHRSKLRIFRSAR